MLEYSLVSEQSVLEHFSVSERLVAVGRVIGVQLVHGDDVGAVVVRFVGVEVVPELSAVLEHSLVS